MPLAYQTCHMYMISSTLPEFDSSRLSEVRCRHDRVAEVCVPIYFARFRAQIECLEQGFQLGLRSLLNLFYLARLIRVALLESHVRYK